MCQESKFPFMGAVLIISDKSMNEMSSSFSKMHCHLLIGARDICAHLHCASRCTRSMKVNYSSLVPAAGRVHSKRREEMSTKLATLRAEHGQHQRRVRK